MGEATLLARTDMTFDEMVRPAPHPMTAAAVEFEELALAFPVSLDLRAMATAHAVAMAHDLAGLALPAGSVVSGVTSTLCEFHIGHRLELVIATPSGPARASLERRQLTDEHPVTWELSYRRRAGSSDVERIGPNAGTGPELLEILLRTAESIAAGQAPPPEPARRRSKS
jgi:hypothetical protein